MTEATTEVNVTVTTQQPHNHNQNNKGGFAVLDESESDEAAVVSIKEPKKFNILSGVWNIANYIIGAGVLGLPYACSKVPIYSPLICSR
jgi:hypothetical protein